MMRMTVLISIMALLAGMNGVPLHAEEPDHGVSALAPKSLEEYRSWTSADKERIYEALVTTAFQKGLRLTFPPEFSMKVFVIFRFHLWKSRKSNPGGG